MDSGVAKRPIEDIEAYRETLDHAVFKSAMLMRPVFDAASKQSRTIAFAEGEDERVYARPKRFWRKPAKNLF